MFWLKAKNGVVIEVLDDLTAGLIEQGHKVFATEAEARGTAKAEPVRRKTS